MVLAIHGEAGGWDELIIAVVALAVLWVAVKLAGRKPADDGEETDAAAGQVSAGEASAPLDASAEAVNGSTRPARERKSSKRSAEPRGPAQPPANRLG
jgi:hypothetical protein